MTEIRLSLKLIKDAPMMKVGVREDPIDTTTHRAQLRHGRLLYGNPTGGKRTNILKHLVGLWLSAHHSSKREEGTDVTCSGSTCCYSIDKRLRRGCGAYSRWQDTLWAFCGQRTGRSIDPWPSFGCMWMANTGVVVARPVHSAPCKTAYKCSEEEGFEEDDDTLRILQ